MIHQRPFKLSPTFLLLYFLGCDTGMGPLPDYRNKILFTSSRNGEQQLYAMNPDGSDARQLTTGPYWHYIARWSPDTRRIVSLTNENITTACVQMVVQNVDGTSRQLIGCGGFMDWSPDGKKIVFAFSPRAELGDRTRSIYVINADGTGLEQLTDSLGIRDDTPSWSPDGQTIAFSSNRDYYPDAQLWSEIYLMDADGSNQRRLTYTDSLINGTPAWSPDGNSIAFTSNAEIVIIEKDGTDLSPKSWTRS
ncbi:MAG: hypothetical protein L0Y80_12945 [Ignavibacteriae bacterium]|nr:hypothetical protein [Ignavibacteriota bacterium]